MTDTSFWIYNWSDALGVLLESSFLISILAIVFNFFVIVIPCGVLFFYLDRKLTADFQARFGPSQAGPSGILQPFADLLKLFQKGRYFSRQTWGEWMWHGVHLMALYSTLAVIPLGSTALLVNTEMSAFLPFWSALVLALGTMLLGLSQNTVPGVFGGIRIASQTLAGGFPALVAMLCVGMQVGGFSWSAFAEAQSFGPLSWTFLSNPFLLIAFLVFTVSGLVLLASSPMDANWVASDIHGGVSSHLFGSRLASFYFGRFYIFFLWSVISVVLFLGAWCLPQGVRQFLVSSKLMWLLAVLEVSWLLLKTFALMLVAVWISRVTPKARVDQNTDLAWKVLSPFALLALVGTSLWLGWGSPQ